MAGCAASTAAGFAAMITSAVADTRKPYSIPMPYAPLPEYPLEGAKHWTGSGLFMVSADVDDGLVNGVTTVRSTGHSTLDKAAEKALYRWKFPHGVLRMMIPVTFTTKGVQISYGTGPKPSSKVGSQNSGVPRLSHDGINNILIFLADHLTRAHGCSILFLHVKRCVLPRAPVVGSSFPQAALAEMWMMHSSDGAALGRHIASGGGTYHHVQRGHLLIVVLGATAGATLAAILATGPQLLLIVALLLQLLATLAFCSSVITITAGSVSIHYGPGWFRRSVALKEIAACRIVRNIFAYGWGMRKAGRRYSIRLSNASAVEFELRNGRRVQIGTDRPIALVEAVFEARHHRNNPSNFRKSTWR